MVILSSIGLLARISHGFFIGGKKLPAGRFSTGDIRQSSLRWDLTRRVGPRKMLREAKMTFSVA
jgi:hypothetical protein